jgi:hypothetical protein
MKIDQVLVRPTTSAVASDSALSIGADCSGWEQVCIHADLLSGAEEVDIYMNSNGTLIPVWNPFTSAAAVLTATAPQIALRGGVEYRVAKDSTNPRACGVYMTGISPTPR